MTLATILALAIFVVSCSAEPPAQRSAVGRGCVGKSKDSPACQTNTTVQTNPETSDSSEENENQKPPKVKTTEGSNEELTPPPALPENPTTQTSQGVGGANVIEIFKPVADKIFENIFAPRPSTGGNQQSENTPTTSTPPQPQATAKPEVTAAPVAPVATVAPVMSTSISVTLIQSTGSYLKRTSGLDVTSQKASLTSGFHYCSINGGFTVSCIQSAGANEYFVKGASVCSGLTSGYLYKPHFSIPSGKVSSSCP